MKVDYADGMMVVTLTPEELITVRSAIYDAQVKAESSARYFAGLNSEQKKPAQKLAQEIKAVVKELERACRVWTEQGG